MLYFKYVMICCCIFAFGK